MGSRDFVPKVKQLEQLKVEFDDANAIEGSGALPINVQSAKQFDVGPTNNSRTFKRKKGAIQKKLSYGLVDHASDNENAYNEEERLTDEQDKARMAAMIYAP